MHLQNIGQYFFKKDILERKTIKTERTGALAILYAHLWPFDSKELNNDKIEVLFTSFNL